MIVYDMIELTQVMPEIILLLVAMILLLIGAFNGNKSMPVLSSFSMLTILFVAFIEGATPLDSSVVFGGLYVNNGYTAFVKLLLLSGAFFSIFMATGYYKKNSQYMIAEFPVLILFATAGMMLMISSNDLMSLYMSLELQSLTLYILASIHRNDIKSSEAGLKYFVLGALASGIMLYGISLIYGFTGTTNFDQINQLYGSSEISLGVIIGLVMLIVGLCFKVSAAPFHMWTPDVYEGAPVTVTAYLSVAPKIAAIGLFVAVIYGGFKNLALSWQQIIIFTSILSMLVGSFGALRQTNIKRLMAYSSIGHVGFILVGFAAASVEGIRGILVYLLIYMSLTLGIFAAIMMIKKDEKGSEDIYAFAGLAKSRPILALAIAVILFSMAGIPPFAGFFGKFFVFMAAVKSKLYIVAILGVLSSVVAAFYYLRIIKIMYFDEVSAPVDRDMAYELKVVTTISAIFNAFFFISFNNILDGATKAASILFN